jgi:hypothetical protein
MLQPSCQVDFFSFGWRHAARPHFLDVVAIDHDVDRPIARPRIFAQQGVASCQCFPHGF